MSSIKNILKNVIETYKQESEDLEPEDCNETVLYELFMNRDSKTLIIDDKYKLNNFENILYTEISDDKLEVIVYDDDYKGYKLTLEAASNNSLKVTNSVKVDEDIIDSIDYHDNCKIIDNL